MKIRMFAMLCFVLLVVTGCTESHPVESDSSSIDREVDVTPEVPAEDEADDPEKTAVEPPLLPYERTVASLTPELAELALRHREDYPATVGWLRVPGTTIDSAVVQSCDRSNEYYLQHDLDGNPSRDGTYSAKTDCNLAGGRGEISRNITLFAHNHDENPDGILFAQLKKYKDPEFALANPYIYFSTCEEDLVWEVFAVFDTIMQYEYIHADPSWFWQKHVLETAMEASIYDYGIVPGRDDRFLTLSTCSFDIPGVGLLPLTPPNDYRFVVLARLVEPGEAKKDEAAITPRESFLLPDDFPIFDDSISLDGWTYHLRESEFHHPRIQPLDESALELLGTVGRTAKSDNPQDWDATRLPVGTEIYADPMYPRVLVADYDGERLFYVADNVRLLLERDGEALAVRPVEEAAAAILWPEDPADEQDLIVDREAPPPRSGEWTVVLEARDDRHTYRYPHYVAAPPALGRDVLICHQYDGYLYRDAEIFQELLNVLLDDAPYGE